MQTINKLTEVTTDALFNLPAILTAQTWTKVAPAYLYSFEHVGQSSNRGSTFLTGLPIVGNEKSANNTVAHGDELAYLFDARDIFGKQLKNVKPLDETDKKVRDIFSSLIKQFAYLNSGQGVKNKGTFQEFKSEQNNFIRIGQEAILGKDFRYCIIYLRHIDSSMNYEKFSDIFRYCQMALWGALVKPSSKDTSCKHIFNQLASSLLTATGNLTTSVGNTLSNPLGILNLGAKKNATSAVPSKSGIQESYVGSTANKKPAAIFQKGSGGLLGIL